MNSPIRVLWATDKGVLNTDFILSLFLKAWKQKAQYLQHKQNKAEATTVKRKATSSEGAPKLKGNLPFYGLYSVLLINVKAVYFPAKIADCNRVQFTAVLQVSIVPYLLVFIKIFLQI